MAQSTLMNAVRSESQSTYEDFEYRMILVLGATVGGRSLTKALGYPSQDAFRKALQRGRLPIRTFEVTGRRGRFAAATDIARWLWSQRAGTESNS
jgi:hypothetical protein